MSAVDVRERDTK